MSLCRPGRDGAPIIYLGATLNPRWVQELNRDNIPCLRNILDITLPNPPGTECYSATKNWIWGMLPGDQRRVTLP
jgi:hypothetical protein